MHSFRQVLTIDPRYAPAWDELARNFLNKSNVGLLPNSEGHLARARRTRKRWRSTQTTRRRTPPWSDRDV